MIKNFLLKLVNQTFKYIFKLILDIKLVVFINLEKILRIVRINFLKSVEFIKLKFLFFIKIFSYNFYNPKTFFKNSSNNFLNFDFITNQKRYLSSNKRRSKNLKQLKENLVWKQDSENILILDSYIIGRSSEINFIKLQKDICSVFYNTKFFNEKDINSLHSKYSKLSELEKNILTSFDKEIFSVIKNLTIKEREAKALSIFREKFLFDITVLSDKICINCVYLKNPNVQLIHFLKLFLIAQFSYTILFSNFKKYKIPEKESLKLAKIILRFSRIKKCLELDNNKKKNLNNQPYIVYFVDGIIQRWFWEPKWADLREFEKDLSIGKENPSLEYKDLVFEDFMEEANDFFISDEASVGEEDLDWDFNWNKEDIGYDEGGDSLVEGEEQPHPILDIKQEGEEEGVNSKVRTPETFKREFGIKTNFEYFKPEEEEKLTELEKLMNFVEHMEIKNSKDEVTNIDVEIEEE